MVSLNTTNTLFAYLGIVFFCLGGVSVLGFNDEAGTVKWSPKYLYEKVYSVPSSVPAKNKLIPSSLPVIYNAARPKDLLVIYEYLNNDTNYKHYYISDNFSNKYLYILDEFPS